ncbi:hypothetical protein D3C87_795880 [compost metagenome]
MADFFNASPVLGQQTVQVTPARSIGPFVAQVTLEETHTDELVITDHPVETGAVISDHAYMRPSEVMIRCGWSESPGGADNGIIDGILGDVGGQLSSLTSMISGSSLGQPREMYNNMLELQRSRIPFEIQTGKRIYQNMLVRSLRLRTDKENENVAVIEVLCREVLIVFTQVVSVAAPAEDQREPGSTSPTVEKGVKQVQPAPNYNQAAGDASAAASFPVTQSTVDGVPLGPL